MDCSLLPNVNLTHEFELFRTFKSMLIMNYLQMLFMTKSCTLQCDLVPIVGQDI